MANHIVIPTYNEKENIQRLVPAVFALLPEARITVVDDNSPDGTAEAVRSLQSSYPNLFLLSRNRKEGLGRAYIHAFKEILKQNPAKLVMMDADLSHHPQYLPAMLAEADSHDVVIGSRYTAGGRTEGWELWRRLLSRYANLYCRTITRLPIRDCTSGFKVINADFLKKIDLSRIDLSGYAFLMELKYALWQAGARFKEVPIIFRNRVGGESKISNHIIREGVLAPWKMIMRKKS